MKLVDIPKLEFALKNEWTNKIKLSHKFLFDTEGDWSNKKRICDFSGFHFQTNSTDLKNKVDKIQNDFPLNDLITICNLLCISNKGFLVNLITRYYLLHANIIENESDTESEMELNSNNYGNAQNDAPLTSTLNNNAETSHSDKNKQFPVQSFLPSDINFTNIESIISTFDRGSFQNNW